MANYVRFVTLASFVPPLFCILAGELQGQSHAEIAVDGGIGGGDERCVDLAVVVEFHLQHFRELVVGRELEGPCRIARGGLRVFVGDLSEQGHLVLVGHVELQIVFQPLVGNVHRMYLVFVTMYALKIARKYTHIL